MDAVASAPVYAATCPECGALPIGTLVTDRSVPVYACVYAGNAHVTVADERRAEAASRDANLVGLELDEAAWIADLGVAIVAGGSGVTWASDPRISLGACGHVVIDGECLLPDDPGEAGAS